MRWFFVLYGCVAAGDSGYILWIEGRIEATKYPQILEVNVLQSVKKLKLKHVGYCNKSIIQNIKVKLLQDAKGWGFGLIFIVL